MTEGKKTEQLVYHPLMLYEDRKIKPETGLQNLSDEKV